MGKIKNISGNKKKPNTHNCQTWIEYWEKQSGRKPPTFCIVSTPDCLEKASVGALVQKVNVTDGKWYVAPLCQTHSNHYNAEFIVYNTWPLVEINTIETSIENISEVEIISDLI
ncbi:MAG TPA: hypothetical protein VNX01_06980 [Bacteroidia bacterium]|nr:hypothetical protein [Bacteroidia bacterium]